MNSRPFTRGLVAAAFTPFDAQGRVNPDPIPAMVEELITLGSAGIYVCGSTGEGPSLTQGERKLLCEAFVAASAGRIPIWLQIGHTSIPEARELAVHAARTGADILSGCSPFYFPVADEQRLLDCLLQMTSDCPEKPFYYYHIPVLTGVSLRMERLLELAREQMPHLTGIKFSAPALHEFQACQDFADSRYDILWGCDEMLLGALASGAQAAIGSTYYLAKPIFDRMQAAFVLGNLEEARHWQTQANDMIQLFYRNGKYHAASKAVLRARGLQVGGVRLPLGNLTAEEEASLLRDLEAKPYGELLLNPAPAT